VVRARLKTHKYIRAPDIVVCRNQSGNFRVRLSGSHMPPLANNLIFPSDNTAHSGIRLGGEQAFLCQCNRTIQ
jgi:hypothetical protein